MSPKAATKAAATETSGRAPMSTTSDAILNETIKKQLRFHHLFENYMLSPNVIKSIYQNIICRSSDYQQANKFAY